MKKHVVSLLLLWSVVFGVWAEKGFVIQGSVDGITPAVDDFSLSC